MNADDPHTVHVIDPNADPGPVPDIVVRPFTENGCTVTPVIIDPADAQYTLYGTVTRPDGTFVGSYYAADNVCGQHWRIVAADGTHYRADSEQQAVATLVHTLAAR
ncbi:hypothetical protein [Amycolatopsis magusensis]|uniref:Uncharacterized protein n=1 Tax=Amycolatopsis magusensis TaxID=882444 RepID=A0ABS4PTY4_9PSEU|nr:hypothetical protein [Amycolatopsis magusensis]MBP2182894.1 hypothetical protein [Amycolatopsis magusensis]